MRAFDHPRNASVRKREHSALRSIRSFAAAAALSLAGNAVAAACDSDDFVTKVTGVHECIVMRRYGAVAAGPPKAILVWLHGDVSSGGPADYHFRIAEKAATDFAAEGVLSIALVRPGYADGAGNVSGGNNYGRSDQYTVGNIEEVGAAITRLRDKFAPVRMIIIGHSGGATTAAVLLGMQPDLADGVVLVSCPCDLGAWRMGRRTWVRSEDPMRWATKARAPVKVVALTGSQDDNTSPELARTFVAALKTRGVDAAFELVPGATHNSAFSSPEVAHAIGVLLKP
jgi:pimeloyl-ACP methyl ester carboxylesterase